MPGSVTSGVRVNAWLCPGARERKSRRGATGAPSSSVRVTYTVTLGSVWLPTFSNTIPTEVVCEAGIVSVPSAAIDTAGGSVWNASITRSWTGWAVDDDRRMSTNAVSCTGVHWLSSEIPGGAGATPEPGGTELRNSSKARSPRPRS